MASRLIAVLLLLALVGCGSKKDPVHDEIKPHVSSGEATSFEPATLHGLACETNLLSHSTLDYLSSTGGAQNPEAAARLLAGPEPEVHVQEQPPKKAIAYLLRADGTAYSELRLIVLDDNTWSIETMQSCSGEAPVPR